MLGFVGIKEERDLFALGLGQRRRLGVVFRERDCSDAVYLYRQGLQLVDLLQSHKRTACRTKSAQAFKVSRPGLAQGEVVELSPGDHDLIGPGVAVRVHHLR